MRHLQTYKVVLDSTVTLEGTQSETGGTELVIDTTVAASQTNFAIAGTIDVSELQSVIIVADKDCTLETNSGTVPVHTHALKAGAPLLWSKSAAYFASPFAATDVTGFFLTTGTSATRLRMRILTT